MQTHDEDLPWIPQGEAAPTEAAQQEETNLEPLPVVVLDEFYKLKKDKKTSSAKFTTQDLFVLVEWPAATAKLKMFMTEDKRTIIQGMEMMEEVEYDS